MRKLYYLAIAVLLCCFSACEKSDVEGGIGMDFNDDINWESLKRVVGMELQEAESLLERAGFEYGGENSGGYHYTKYREGSGYDTIFLETSSSASNSKIEVATWARESEDYHSLAYDYVNDILIGQIKDLFPEITNNGDWYGAVWYSSSLNRFYTYEECVQEIEEATDYNYKNGSDYMEIIFEAVSDTEAIYLESDSEDGFEYFIIMYANDATASSKFLSGEKFKTDKISPKNKADN